MIFRGANEKHIGGMRNRLLENVRLTWIIILKWGFKNYGAVM
jgi:hypothetical protein